MGMFDQIKEAMSMRSEAKRMEAEVKKIAATKADKAEKIIRSFKLSADRSL